MKKKIIDVLKLNKLYRDDEKINLNNCNKLEDFFLTYKYNSFRKNFLPNNIVRNEKGYILLDEIPFIVSNIDLKKDNENMHNNCKWIILNNGSKVLLKETNYFDDKEKELIIMYFLKYLNMKCANYDIAEFKGQDFLITPSFLTSNEKIFNPFTDFQNIVKTQEECKMLGINVHHLKTTLADIIYGNPDRKRNFGIIVKGDKHRICPLFDNAELSLSDYEASSFPYIANELYEPVDIVLNYLLSFEEILNWLEGPFKNVNLLKIVENIKRDMGIEIPNETYVDFENYFKDSEYHINKALKNKGKSSKIHLT